MLENNQKNLILIQDLGMHYPKPYSLHKSRYGIYKCKCGKEVVMISKNVKTGLSKSCGCGEKTIKKFSKHKLYHYWRYIINTKMPICKEWLDIKNFIEDMYPSYKEGFYLRRVDTKREYNKNNCIWISKEEKTQKKKSKHRLYTFWRYITNKKFSICQEWLNIENFINDMDSSYKAGLRLKRIDEDKPYSKNNCIWIAKKEKVKKEVEDISDYKGVNWNKLKNKWVTRIDVYGKLKTIGYFEDKFDAAWAYDKYIIDNYLPHSTNFVH